MRLISLASGALAVAWFCSAGGAAQAASNRVWVSGHGLDQAGCGAPTSPCRSLQYAHDNAVATGGEIDILDPAGYGAISITKSISIVNDGVGTAGVQATSGNAITVNLPSGGSQTVYLRGLNVDGVQKTGAIGIQVLSAQAVSIVNCVVRHFSGAGILVEGSNSTTTTVAISNTVSSDNGGDGFDSESGAAGVISGVIDHFTTENDVFGIDIGSGATTGSAFTSYVISDVTSSDNQNGLSVTSGAGQANVTVDIDTSSLSNNLFNGLAVANSPLVHLSRLLIAQNGAAGLSNGVASPGAVFSDGTNHIGGNDANVTVAPQADPLN